MVKRPLVSVIMPVYNAEKFIQEAVNSVLRQTYKNLELIIVDDASTDGSLGIIEKYSDPRIRIYRNEENRGISYSTNRAISSSRGKYIALLDDDDIAVCNRIRLQVDFMEQNEDVDILGGASAEIDSDGQIIKFCNIPRFNPRYIKAVLLFNCMDFYNGTAMIRKKFIEEHNLQYSENCYGMQDLKFYMESSKYGKITTIGNLLLYHRIHEKSETNRSKLEFAEKRKNAYAAFQRDSLAKSGFVLDESTLDLFNRVLAEGTQSCCDSLDEVKELYHAFSELLRQARLLNLDYYNELELLCKRKLGLQLERMDVFNWEKI